jgi:hypothetical protein
MIGGEGSTERFVTDTASLWDEASRLGAYFGLEPLAMPERITRLPVKLSRSRWPDCSICNRTVDRCQCDPDATYQRRLDALRDRLNQQGETR